MQEGPRVYVERIDINGNVRTLDKVIRREFRLVEGDAFNTSKMQRSKDRIKNLGFFKKVEVTNSPGSAPDRTVITVEVEEQSTGELSLGVGFSTSDGPLADISIRERNFLGRGQDFRIGTVISLRSQQVDLSFTEPYFLDKNIAAGIDLFEIKTSPTNQFLHRRHPGLSAVLLWRRAARRLSDYREPAPDLEIHRPLGRHHRCRRATPRCSSSCRTGTHLTSAIGQVLLYDRRDNRHRADERLLSPRSATTSPVSASASNTFATRSTPDITIRLRRNGC